MRRSLISTVAALALAAAGAQAQGVTNFYGPFDFGTGQLSAGSAVITGTVTAGQAALAAGVSASYATLTGAVSAGSLDVTGTSTLSIVNAASAALTGALTAGSGVFNGTVTMNQPASIVFGGTRTWSGGETAVTNAEVSSFTNQTGSSTSGPVAYHFFRVASDTVQAGAAGGASNIESDLYTGAGITGFRASINASLSVNGQPGDGSQYSTGVFSFQATAPASASGNFGFGANPTCGIESGATGDWACVGEEIDVAAASGTTPTAITGLSIVPVSNHAVQGSLGQDTGLVFGSQSASAGWNYGIRFGGPNNSFPFNVGATLIYSWAANGGSTIANGVDLHNNTFTGNSWNDGHVQITGGGQIVQAKISDPNTAPGAGKLQLTVEAGTTAGTCKIVARAGTSATPVTIVDNVGSGC